MKRAVVLVLLVACIAVAACGGGATAAGQASIAGLPATTAASAPPGPPQPMEFGPVVPGTAPEHDYTPEQVARGRTLVTIGSCNDCHTPWNISAENGMPYPDMERMLSGHPQGAPDPYGTVDPRDTAIIGPTFTSFAMPIGVTYALNLTPDIDTGTGSWSEEMFLAIFREAKHMGGNGRSILPPMPWPSVASLPDEDIVAIFAYLRSIPPIRNAVPSSKVPQEIIDAIGVANQQVLEQIRAQGQH